MTKQIQFASTAKVASLDEEVSAVLWHIAAMMKEPEETEEEWLSSTFVSDESRIADFLFEDSELQQLQQRIGIADLAMRDLICDVASRLRQQPKEVNV